MIQKQSIIDCLQTDYNLDISTLTPLSLGADTQAITYKAITNNEQEYFVKAKQGYDSIIGLLIQMLLYNIRIDHIINPISTHYGQPVTNSNEYIVTVYPFIEGSNGFTRNLTDSQWIELGRTLNQIHSLDIPPLFKDHITKESYSCEWQENVKATYNKIDNKEIATDAIGLKLLAFMEKHRETILLLVEKAHTFGQKAQEKALPFVLCHSDIHAGNVLLTDDEKMYIIDWDQPIMAPKERDLMFIGGGIANTWNNVQEEMLFYAGYGNVTIDLDAFYYYRHERIVKDIAIYSTALLDSAEGDNREIMYQHFIDMFEPNGVVDIALHPKW